MSLNIESIGEFIYGGFKVNGRYITSSEKINTFSDGNELHETMPLNHLFIISFNIHGMHSKKHKVLSEARVMFFCKNGIAKYKLVSDRDSFNLELESITKGDLITCELDRLSSLPTRFANTRFIGVCATTIDGVIGRKGNSALMWHCPEDLKIFKETTENSVLVMGGATFRAIGRPLPNRITIVITKDVSVVEGPNVFKYNGLKDFLDNALIDVASVRRIYVVGGEDIFKLFEDYITHYQITQIPIVSEEEEDVHYAYMPVIHPLKFIKNIPRHLPAVVNNVKNYITIHNYKRRSFIGNVLK